MLGVSAGIAAYKAVEVCRRLVDAGVHVAPVLTERATRFVGRATFDALGSEPTQTSVWDEASPIPHTRLGQKADLIVVAPATADLLARYAAGLADDLLTTTLVATAAPVVVCPAMHTEMWEHPTVRDNLALLVARGVTVVPPEDGRLAGGDVGSGRMAEPATIAGVVLDLLGARAPRPPATWPACGYWSRPAAPARPSTRCASSPTGRRESRATRWRPSPSRRGAEVVLVTTSSLPRPPGVEVVEVETAAQMEEAMLSRASSADVIVMAAAVADFRPKVAVDTKLHKSDGIPDLVLEATNDILAELGRRRSPGQVLVGFAAETDDVPARARAKLVAKGVDLMVANDVSAPQVGFDHDTNAVTIFGADGTDSTVPLSAKVDVADAVVDRVVRLLAAHRA